MSDAAAHHLRSSGLALESHISGRKIAQSTGEAWAGLEAQIFRRRSREDELLVPAVAEPFLVWLISGEALIEECDPGGEWHGGVAKAGSFFFTHADTPYLMRWQAREDMPFEVMHLYLDRNLIDRAALTLGLKAARCRFHDISIGVDSLISGIMTGLVDELRAQREANVLFVQGLAQSLTIHLLREYSDVSDKSLRAIAQLPAWRLRAAVDHMEVHLGEPFDLDRLADICQMSRFHFSRAFHNTTGVSPSRWFIRRRVDHAKQMLRECDAPIIEISMAVGYDSPGHFAQVFRRETGMSPRAYRLA
ncbi:MAG TPA: AraC family transcriptional regulator [Mesorhizobium sp.]|jgi:AraC family transcriptional regulator|uniref:AraC family transcriptional regulator n=1 Tax=Mesorhizobium sp. TaxID=1871066 RepID=UPI002DDD7CBF|nr:AraC family transcriptional regulator [Mesorhizobium sp.]HEV2505655.1 AraC family transcriptional regulator [Mesorhizobium sp.]